MGWGRSKNAARPLLILLFTVLPAAYSVAWAAGYSIDVTVSDLSTGQTAGAFFVAAATVDEIIPRLADLASDISEKIFGVKTAHRPPPALPAAQRQEPLGAVPAQPASAGAMGVDIPLPAPVPAPVPASPTAAA